MKHQVKNVKRVQLNAGDASKGLQRYTECEENKKEEAHV
jgi:hypothetical protein